MKKELNGLDNPSDEVKAELSLQHFYRTVQDLEDKTGLAATYLIMRAEELLEDAYKHVHAPKLERIHLRGFDDP